MTTADALAGVVASEETERDFEEPGYYCRVDCTPTSSCGIDRED